MPLVKSMRSVMVLSAFALPLGVSASFAADPVYTSTYSDLDFTGCEIVHEDSEFGFVEWRCDGNHGYDILATEADLRIYIAFQKDGALDGMPITSADAQLEEDAVAGESSLGQTIPPFNNLGPKLEWRLPSGAGAEPFATIVRYHYQNDFREDGKGQVLVVSRFRKGETCHVAYIDALANQNANVMAREVADKFATGGECPDGVAPVIGNGGDALR